MRGGNLCDLTDCHRAQRPDTSAPTPAAFTSKQICLKWWRDDGKQKRGEREESSCGSLWLQTSVISVPSSWCLNPQLGPRQSLSHTYTYMYRDMCMQKHREQAPDTWALWRCVFIWILAKENVALMQNDWVKYILYLLSVTLSHYTMGIYNSLASEFSNFLIRLLNTNFEIKLIVQKLIPVLVNESFKVIIFC